MLWFVFLRGKKLCHVGVEKWRSGEVAKWWNEGVKEFDQELFFLPTTRSQHVHFQTQHGNEYLPIIICIYLRNLLE